MKRNIFQNIFRFLQIDLYYLRVDLPFSTKLENIFYADLQVIKNLTFRSNTFSPVAFNNTLIEYDTPYATKTFLAAVYDFFVESQRRSLFSSKPIIIDIGANIGQFLFATKSFFPNALVYSVEPDPEIFKILKKNSKSLNNVKLFNFAISDTEGPADFYVSSEFSEWSSLKKSSSSSKKVKVETILGDKIFSHIKNIDLLKVDVEGTEFKVIKGMKKTLQKSRYLIIEVSLLRNKEDPGSSKLIKFLLDNKFYIHSIGRVFSDGLGKKQGAVDIIFKNILYE